MLFNTILGTAVGAFIFRGLFAVNFFVFTQAAVGVGFVITFFTCVRIDAVVSAFMSYELRLPFELGIAFSAFEFALSFVTNFVTFE